MVESDTDGFVEQAVGALVDGVESQELAMEEVGVLVAVGGRKPVAVDLLKRLGTGGRSRAFGHRDPQFCRRD